MASPERRRKKVEKVSPFEDKARFNSIKLENRQIGWGPGLLSTTALLLRVAPQSNAYLTSSHGCFEILVTTMNSNGTMLIYSIYDGGSDDEGEIESTPEG